MNTDYLVNMANDISNFHASEGDVALAAAGVEAHMARYWEKRMRQQIIAHHHAGGEGLSEISRAAVALLEREGKAAPQLHANDEGTGGDAG